MKPGRRISGRGRNCTPPQRSTNPFEMDRPAVLGVRHNAASYLPNVRITPIFFKNRDPSRIRIAVDLRRNRWTGIPY
jgi:hypothetical protein